MMLRVTAIPSVNEACADDLLGKTAIVVDVLRATSTIVTALHNGCAGIVPVETVCQAKDSRTDNERLGGERNGRRIPGFEYGNSPFEYMSPELQGETIIMTTTNGTRAIQKAVRASAVLAAAMLNAAAAASYALSLKRDVALICAGTKDRFSLEDGLCAGLIICEIERISGAEAELNDFGMAMRSAYMHAAERLADELLACRNGRRLTRAGLKEDVLYCAQRNICDTVPVLHGSMLTALQAK